LKNRVHLIAYADRFGGTLTGLRELLAGPFAGLFGGVHVLPFFEPIDGADAGFDPTDHTAVDRRLGSWADVAALAGATEVTADVIVNHISSRSPQFRDFLANGERSAYAGLFLTRESVFGGAAVERDVLAIYRPRPGPPFTSIALADGTRRLFWTTFTAEQIDIDVTHARGREYLEGVLRVLAAHGVKTVRLDAVGYAIKKPGTSCFMIDETFEFIRSFADRARAHGLDVLVEVHSHFEQQIEIARHVDRVYDFALPPLVLHALATGTARHLRRWIDVRPRNAVTVLDTHDGIGVVDVAGHAGRAGLIADEELTALVERIHRNSRGESRRATGAAASNLDLYQVNCTFYDALGRDDLAYLLARAIQFFLPGVPQVYYVGLLAGHNDMALLERTRVGRDVNRHYYSRAEIDAALERPVVARLLELIRLRSGHPAFQGEFAAAAARDDELDLRWRHGDDFARLHVSLRTRAYRLEYSHEGRRQALDLGDCGAFAGGNG
jgi:sucrose phosphorylase